MSNDEQYRMTTAVIHINTVEKPCSETFVCRYVDLSGPVLQEQTALNQVFVFFKC